ncbi:MAG: hypothetical protein RMJ18_02615 [Candidatus Aenigmarchaeota archaeon]|nr:hypothetical protein [Candidatus Aenigmarchaeota archaeon]MDW8160284.1 hypothetical protein [Candidatus Aenigmarchaeota archaeon]
MSLPFMRQKQRPIPIDRVKELSKKGFSEIEIIDILRKEGYSPNEIDLALSQSLKESIESSVKTTNVSPGLQNPLTQPERSQEKQEINIERFQQASFSQQTDQGYYFNWDDYFNYIDYLIQSRISEISSQIKVLEERYTLLEKRLQEAINEIKNEKAQTSDITSKIIGEFSKVEKDIKDMYAKIEGLEEIFKEILPALIESVRSLANLAKKQSI